MDLCAVIGNNIKRLRAARGLSQEELAFRAGIDRSHLSEIENGYKNLGVLMLDTLAAALDVNIVVLLKGYDRSSK
jgi:transcriptional regulator with XRE-family HTH domain